MTRTLEDLLTTTLVERADDIRDGDALDADYATEVLARGRTVQRRRRIGTALGSVGLVTALAIGGTYAVQRQTGTDPDVAGPPAATVSATSQRTAATAPPSGVRFPGYDNLPVGEPIRVLPRVQVAFPGYRVSPSPTDARVEAERGGVSVVLGVGASERAVKLPDGIAIAAVVPTKRGAVAIGYSEAHKDDASDPQAQILSISQDGQVDSVETGLVIHPVVSPDANRYAYVKTPDPNVPSERVLVIRSVENDAVQLTVGLPSTSNADQLATYSWTSEGIIVAAEMISESSGTGSWVVGVVKDGETSVSPVENIRYATRIGKKTLQAVADGDGYCLQVVAKLGDRGKNAVCGAALSTVELDSQRLLVSIYDAQAADASQTYAVIDEQGKRTDVPPPKSPGGDQGVTVFIAEDADNVIVQSDRTAPAQNSWVRWHLRTGRLEQAPLPEGADAVLTW